MPLNSSSIRRQQCSVRFSRRPLQQRHSPGTSRCEPEHLQVFTCCVRSLRHGTCSSISTFSLYSLSIITTSPYRRSPSILASSSFLRHVTVTTISRLLRSPSFHRRLPPDHSRERNAILVHHDDFSRDYLDAQVHAILPQARQLYQVDLLLDSKSTGFPSAGGRAVYIC